MTFRMRMIALLGITLLMGTGWAQAQSVTPWSIDLSGTRSDTLESAYFEEAKAHGSHYQERNLTAKGVTRAYRGMPLSKILAMVDGSDSKHPYRFDADLWKAGYEVTITARDGYAVTFSTADLTPDALLLADTQHGQPVAPMIVGDAPTKLWVKDVASIEADLGELAASPVFELTLDINGTVSSFSIADLEESPFYSEGCGSYTTSAGTTYEGNWGGVTMDRFLGQFAELHPQTSISLIAVDGYEMTYSGEQVLDTADGTWILAFKMDGEYLPEDPGYIRTIKVGADCPNITGHSSVRMIQTIRIAQAEYRDFSLAISGRMDWTLDRQTLQSGVSCHRRVVDFEHRSDTGQYTGIPLYLLLAYADDPQWAPHHQSDRAILSYQKGLAQTGYKVEIVAADGYTITLDSKDLDGNDDVILGMYKDGQELPDRELPLVLVWDKHAGRVPEGIKPIRQIVAIRLVM